MIAVKKKTVVPLYGVILHLLVSPEHKEIENEIAKITDCERDSKADYRALATSSGKNFVISILMSEIEHGIIAHEVFHVTHMIMEYTGDKFNPNHDEPYAYLCEWITDWVYKMLGE